MGFSRRQFLKTSTRAAAVLGTGLASPAVASPALPWKKGILLSGLPKKISYLERFRMAREGGFEQIEAYTVFDQKEAEEIRKSAEETKVGIVSVMNAHNFKYPLSSEDPTVLEKAVDGLRTSLGNAKLWGARFATIVPGVVDSRTSYRDAWVRSQKQVRALLPLAEEHGVVLVIEEVWSKFLLSPLEFASYLDSFGTRWLRAHFDVGNVVINGYPQDWIRTLGNRIAYVHLKDFDTKSYKFVELGDGDVDWPQVRTALLEVGYNGTVSPELFIKDLSHLQDVSRRVDRLLAG